MSESENIDKKCFDRVTAEYIDGTYIRNIKLFSQSLSERVLPNFEDIEEEAKQLGEGWYNSAHNEFEMDVAFEKSADWFVSMSKVRQSLINLHAVGLRHLFEQQIYDLTYIARVDEPFNRRYKKENHRDKRTEEEKKALRHADLAFEIELLKENGGIDLKTLAGWDEVKELICVSNAVKHAEGSSVVKLRKNYPSLLKDSSLLSDNDCEIHKLLANRRIKRAIRNPLAGEEIYVTERDIERYANAIESVWRDLIRCIRLGHE